MKPIEEIVTNTCTAKPVERKARPHKEQALNCPRCNSTNTKFCYYNNYSLTQPRYFCKTCRRYWTEGGSLRNIPVGGGSRKNKRSTSTPSSSSSSKKLPDLVNTTTPSIITSNLSQGQDLNLAFPSTTQGFSSISELVQVPTNNSNNNENKDQIAPSSTSGLSALELLTGMSSRGLNSFIQMPAVPNSSDHPYTHGFPMHDFKPSLNFSLDGLGNSGATGGYGHLHGVHENNGRLLFPFEDLKQVPGTAEQNRDHQQHGDSTSGYWTGMLGGGSW